MNMEDLTRDRNYLNQKIILCFGLSDPYNEDRWFNYNDNFSKKRNIRDIWKSKEEIEKEKAIEEENIQKLKAFMERMATQEKTVILKRKEKQLEGCLEREEYEVAAILRDEIIQLRRELNILQTSEK